jgi:formylglycine-generating enzyme required for sulfatase activity
MSDATIKELAYDTDGRYTIDLVPREGRFDDDRLVTAEVGQYKPNAWGLHDMHGNIWEWTRSEYKFYPYKRDDGRNSNRANGRKTVRGGSWRDRPKYCRSAVRLNYPSWQKIYNVGFRIVIESDERTERFASSR